MKKSKGGGASPAVVEAAQELDAIVKSEQGEPETEDIATTLARTAENLSKAIAPPGDARPKGKGTKLVKGEGGGDGDGPGGELISGRPGGKQADDADEDADEDAEEDDDTDNPDGQQDVKGGDEESDDAQKSLWSIPVEDLYDDREDLYKALLDDDDYSGVVEASPALQHLTSVFGIALEGIAKSQKALDARLQRIESNQALVMKSHAVLHKSMRGGVKPVQPGVMGVWGDPARTGTNGAGSKLSKGDVVGRLTQAVRDGKLSSDYLLLYDTHGDTALQRVPEDVLKSYGIPIPKPVSQ